MNDERLKNLRKMLEQVDAGTLSNQTQGESLEGAVRGRLEGMEVPAGANRGSSLAEQEMTFAQESLDAFVQGKEIDSERRFMLEAIVMPFKRPVVDVIHNKMVENQLTSDWKSLATDVAKKSVIESVVLSIGRIEVPHNVQFPYAGTGFIVGHDLIMTNRHVASVFALGLGARNLTFIPGQTSKIDFIQELDNPESEALEVLQVEMIHPYWDMALLRVSGLSATRQPLKLSTADPTNMVGTELVTIGYPGFDPAPNREFQRIQSRVFRDVYYVKRLQPGKLQTHEEIDSFGHPVQAITHDCSTLGGNSGSAVVDLNSGHVIGLHFAGAYLHANYAVPAIDLASDRRVVDAGVLFANDPVPATREHEAFWIAAESESVGGSSDSSAGQTVQSPFSGRPIAAAPVAHSTSGSEATWTVPLVITIDVGAASRLGEAPTAAVRAPAGLHPGTNQVEGLFGPPPKVFSLTEMAEMFSETSLTKNKFDMSTALSLAAASKFVYESGSVIEPFGVGGFGFETCKFIEASDTQCFIASTSNAILVAFRGTASIGDWLTNLRVMTTQRPYGKVHTGFLRGFEFVQMQLETELSRLSDHPILITGHSLGGALATVAAAEWAGKFDIAAIYTYGQPGVGRRVFASFVDREYQKKFFRFVNNSDVVTRVPPSYEHVGRLFHFDKNGTINAALETLGVDAEMMMTESEFAALQASLSQAARAPETESVAIQESVFTSFSDHGMDRYIKKIREAAQ